MRPKKYNKKEIVDLVAVQLREEIINNLERYKDDTELLEDLEILDSDEDIHRKFEKRFVNVISFLTKPEVRDLLGDPRQDSKQKNYFYSKQMSITSSDVFKGKNNAYQLNVIDALLMISLMLIYNHESFDLVRRESLIFKPETLMDSWKRAFEKRLNILCEFLKKDIEEDTSLPSVEIIQINLMSLFWKLYPLVEKHNKGLNGDLAGIAAAYGAVPEELKEDLYEKKLKKPLNDIKEALLLLINNMKDSEDKSNYREFTYNFDLEYDAYEYLSELSNEASVGDLTNLLQNKFYDEENEPKDDKEKQ